MQPVVYSITATLKTIDWTIIILYFVFSLLIGLYFTRRATKSTREYFTSGQGVSWWLLGTSMVATTFAADTPLAVSGLVMKQGIAGNWFWWCGIPMGIIGVFFFSRLWRRTALITDTELISLRYSGKAANALRGFKAVYFAIPYNCIVIGWVNLAMANIVSMTLHIDKFKAVLICFFITMAYSALAGLWGVLVTDFFQFILAIGMAIFLAVYAVGHIGGMDALLSKLTTLYGDKAAGMTNIIPSNNALAPLYNEPLLPMSLFLIYILLSWWTTGNTDGGSYFAQRMLSAKNEKHAFLGFLWFNVANYCLRPWPWIVVGLVAAVMFPGIADPANPAKVNPEVGYIAVMLSLLPPGLLGLMLASFLAAYMSTIATQLNWGASYLVNDFYRPFVKKEATEKHYVLISTAATILIALIGAVVTFFLNDIFTAWLIISSLNAGVGLVYLARWYWWRVNAWSEISAIATAIVMAIVLLFGVGPHVLHMQIRFPVTLLFTVPVSLIVWISVTMLTQPTDESRLLEFYSRVHPGGRGWRAIAAMVTKPMTHVSLATWRNIICAVLSIIAVLCTLIGVGKLILQNTGIGLVLLTVAVACGIVVYARMGAEKWTD